MGAIILNMRTVCFWLMIVLMPLRAWAGDAMALQMASAGLNHDRAELVAVTPSSGMAECHGHNVSASLGANDAEQHLDHAPASGNPVGTAHGQLHDGPTGHSDGHNCLHCDICQGKAHGVLLPAGAFSSAERVLPAYGSNPMELGPTAAFFKPPIL